MRFSTDAVAKKFFTDLQQNTCAAILISTLLNLIAKSRAREKGSQNVSSF